MTAGNPKLLTIILNYRTPELTLRATEAALHEMTDLDGEILIVENGSADNSLGMLQDQVDKRGWAADGRVRVVDAGRNGGFGAGVNFGIRTGLNSGEAPDFYYLLNSDAWPDAGAIRVLCDFLINHPKAGMAGSYIHGEEGEPHRTAFRFPSAAGEFEMAARTGVVSRLFQNAIVPIEIPKSTTRIDWTAGASLMIRRAMIDEIGGFDETFFLYFEETDLCLRAARAGWEVYYLPDSSVAHIGSASTGMKSWDRTPPYWFDSRLHYFRKNHGSLYAGVATMARLAGSAIYGLRRLISGKPQADPDRFMGDLAAHWLRNLRPSAPGAATGGDLAPTVMTRTKDSQ
ncbi:glycosyltransferase family 2 protein [Primorskyibacter sp. S87]|uniref:glycosyltransferase family 2 protein n=1 Tax=Primorskyibacter sp. S87 TaxID=3415126 RepID=UPI003C79A92A